MRTRPAIVRTPQAMGWQQLTSICARRMADMRHQCVIPPGDIGRHEPSASPSVERRYDRRGGVYAHIITHYETVTYRKMRARMTSYAHG